MAQQHEIRLALVMNGGVSLAVWMGGVAHELDLIRRATTENTPAPRARTLLSPIGGVRSCRARVSATSDAW